MASPNESTVNISLQILFGIAAIFSVVVALFGLHHRDSIGFVLYRRLRSRHTECTYTSLVVLPSIACGR